MKLLNRIAANIIAALIIVILFPIVFIFGSFVAIKERRLSLKNESRSNPNRT